jgi:hypothetical protein
MTFHLAEAVDDVLEIGLGTVADDVMEDPSRVA